MEATMRLNQHADSEMTSTTNGLSQIGLRIRELSEAEVVEKILNRTGPGSLMDDLAKMPPVPEHIGRIRLR